MFILLFSTVKVHHKQPQQVMDFSLFIFALYLLWDNFLISEMTTNNTTKKTPCQPVCAFLSHANSRKRNISRVA